MFEILIPEKEFEMICQLVDSHSGSLEIMLLRLRGILPKVTSVHVLTLGYLMGHRNGAAEAEESTAYFNRLN